MSLTVKVTSPSLLEGMVHYFDMAFSLNDSEVSLPMQDPEIPGDSLTAKS